MSDGLDERAAAPPSPGQLFDDLLTRLGLTGVFARDSALALIVGLLSAGLFASLAPLSQMDPSLEVTTTQAWVVPIVGFVQALPLSLRRLRPGLCFGVIMVVQLALVAYMPDIMARGFGPLFAAYALGAFASTRFMIWAVAIAASAEGFTSAVAMWGNEEAATFAILHFGTGVVASSVAAFIGVYVAGRRQHLKLMWDRAEDLIRAQRERNRAAIAAERTSIARELHDVAAHHLSGMVVQAAAVERLIDRDVEAAKSGAQWIRTQGKSTLDNMRHVVGLLRDDGLAEHAPVPGLSALDELVNEARGLGDQVTFEQEGEQRQLPPIADIAMYRIAQQSLTNARQHAPGTEVSLRLTFGENEVELSVTNGPAPRTATAGEREGAGLLGMRERAELVGAGFEARPSADGGWTVQARLPLPEADDPNRHN